MVRISIKPGRCVLFPQLKGVQCSLFSTSATLSREKPKAGKFSSRLSDILATAKDARGSKNSFRHNKPGSDFRPHFKPGAPIGQASKFTPRKTETGVVVDPTTRQLADLKNYMERFARSAYVQRKVTEMGVPSDIYVAGMDKFSKALVKNEIERLTPGEVLTHIKARSRMERILLPAFYRFITAAFPSRTEKLASLISFSDLTSPADWYEETRKTKRRFILHVGPTNSGKTYAALKRFEEVESAIYCGPLRLLAHEVYERMNAKGIPCNLLTGEERRESDGVHKTAATVEMAPVGRRFQVAVLDEIQMIGDPSRGWAWTQAVLGIQADEVHLCGEPTAVPLIMAMTEDTGDIVEVKEYERLTPLKVSAHSLNSDLTSLRRGDCIATFSRQNIFALKRQIEQKTALKAAVIYGSLPPETRTEQARQFNDPNGPYDVLVASDAIGMGLNLNIGRMIFERMEKWNGQSVEQLSVSQTKQIAGRAGRFQTQWENGECCTFDEYDMPALREAMRMPTPGVTAAGLLPTLEQLELFHRLLPEETLTALLDRFQDLASLHGRYFLCNLTSVQKIATLIEPVPLPLRERYVFTLAPCNADEPVLGVAMLAFAKAHAAGEECGLEEFVKLGTLPPGDVEELRDLEGVHRLIVLYMWLGLRFPETFIDTDLAHHLKKECEAFINEGLAHLKFERKKKVKGAAKVARRLALAESESESSTSTTEAGTAGESAVGEGTQPRGDAEQVVAEHDMPPVKVTKPRLAASERY